MKNKTCFIKISFIFFCSNTNFKPVSIQRYLRARKKSTMHPSKNYKLFINPALAHFVWLAANVHKPSKAGEQQDDPRQQGQPRTSPQPQHLPKAAQGARTDPTAPVKPSLPCTLGVWLSCSSSLLAQWEWVLGAVLKNSHQMANPRMSFKAERPLQQ